VEILGTVRADPHRSVQDEVTSVLLTANNSDDGGFISSVTSNSDGDEESQRTVAVAVRQGNIVATAFHPELTNDLRWHRFISKNLTHLMLLIHASLTMTCPDISWKWYGQTKSRGAALEGVKILA
jgi:hypothetical protein